MKNTFIYFLLLIVAPVSLFAQPTCNWQTQFADGFEYTSICPDLLPGLTIHNTPQTFAVHSGNRSLYLNFTNCVSGSGACVGDTVYRKVVDVCINMPIQASMYLTTSFSGLQCNVRFIILDANNNILADAPSILAPYAPNWLQYTSGSVIPTTSTVTFVMITNVAGGAGGNDLSLDDFLLEQCYNLAPSSSQDFDVCKNLASVNLFGALPFGTDTSGVWAGPSSTLGGGYQGSINPATGTLNGTYVYTTTPYGSSLGCPAILDSVDLFLLTPPNPQLGNNITICLSETALLNPQITDPNVTYLWNNGATTNTLLASSLSLINDTILYTIAVSDTNTCIGIDTVQVIFNACTGLAEESASNIQINYNNSNNLLQIDIPNIGSHDVICVIKDLSGKIIFSSNLGGILTQFNLPINASGIYLCCLYQNENSLLEKKFLVTK